MSVKIAQTFLISLKPDQIDSWIKSLVFAGVNFEPLSPQELGKEWSDVQLISPLKTNLAEELNLLSEVLDHYKPKGFLASLTENRVSVTFTEVAAVEQDLEKNLHIALLLRQYQRYTQLLDQLENFREKTKSQKDSFVVGENLDNFETELYKFISRVVDDFNQKHHNQPKIYFEKPILKMHQLLDYSIIEFHPEDAQVIKDFLTEGNYEKKAYLISDFIDFLNTQKKDIRATLDAENFIPVKLSRQNFKRLAATHAFLQLQEIIAETKNKVFQVGIKPKVVFMFLAVTQNTSALLQKLAKENPDIVCEPVSWSEEIVEWKNKGDLGSFQSIPQAMGTISRTESDPTIITAILFSLFFAFCLADAFYGLIITLVTGGLLFFTKLKPAIKDMVTIFFWSGVVTVIYGVLTNSWAGNLFRKTPVGPFFANLQVLDPLSLNPAAENSNLDKNPIVNQWLIEAGNIHPIAFLLGLSLAIGLVTIFIGYLLKINNSLKSRNYLRLASNIAWIGFLVSLFVYVFASVSGVLPHTNMMFVIGFFTIGLFIFNEGKNFLEKIVSGLGSLYGLISFGSDVLSFTRLVAVGLTSGIIANVINQLGSILYEAIPDQILGMILLIIFLIVGHIFNLVIALFGAYINPLRLNYVEFYPKFFEGNARQIKPLQNQFFYLTITDN